MLSGNDNIFDELLSLFMELTRPLTILSHLPLLVELVLIMDRLFCDKITRIAGFDVRCAVVLYNKRHRHKRRNRQRLDQQLPRDNITRIVCSRLKTHNMRRRSLLKSPSSIYELISFDTEWKRKRGEIAHLTVSSTSVHPRRSPTQPSRESQSTRRIRIVNVSSTRRERSLNRHINVSRRDGIVYLAVTSATRSFT